MSSWSATRTGHCSTWRHGPKTPDAPSPVVFLGVLPGRKGTFRPLRASEPQRARGVTRRAGAEAGGGYPG